MAEAAAIGGAGLELADLRRTFGRVIALDGLSLRGRARKAVRVRRAQRGRQDDDNADRVRPAGARTAGL